ncbi:restriction endonuclease subunit S [Gelidibacter japonicus]|uniref:restriction endonuclease subunit S n=1 Tax=Gelidibacter japonicus TaxID=1962232 RepID=UPI003A93A98A
MREGWKQVKIGEVCKINKKNINKKFEHNQITYLDISSVGSGEAQFDNLVPIEEAPSRAKRIPSLNDSLIATVRPGNKTYYYLKDFPSNTVISTGFAVLTPSLDKVDSRYLYYIISEDSFISYLVSIEKGANYPAVTAKDIADAIVTLPPLKTQRKIASILSAYDDLIENNLKRIKLLEEQAQLTYEEWFVRFKFPGHETTKFDEESGLPEGWEKVKLSKIATFMNGYAFKPKDLGDKGLPVIKIKEMKNGLNSDSPRNCGENIPDKYIVENGDILFSWSASLEVVIWLYEKGLVNQHLFKVTPAKGFGYSYVYLATKNSLKIFDSLTTGATMKHIKRKELDFVKLNKPEQIKMNSFEKIVRPMFNSIINLSKQNQHLKEARDILLPRLMSGMIDVEKHEVGSLKYEVNDSLGMVAEEKEVSNKK